MPLVQRLAEQNGFRVAFYSVDGPSGVDAARGVIDKLELPSKTSSIEGLGDRGPLFRMLGSMEGNMLSWGIWAIVDTKGILRNTGMRYEALEAAVAGYKRDG